MARPFYSPPDAVARARHLFSRAPTAPACLRPSISSAAALSTDSGALPLALPEDGDVSRLWQSPQLLEQIRRRDQLRRAAQLSDNIDDHAIYRRQCQLVARQCRAAKERLCLAQPHLTDAVLQSATTVSATADSPYSCLQCDRHFRHQTALDAHLSEHTRCPEAGCSFAAHRSVVAQHVRLQHETGLATAIMALNTPEAIARWRQQRRDKFARPAQAATTRQCRVQQQQQRQQRQQHQQQQQTRPGRGARGAGRGRAGPTRDSTEPVWKSQQRRQRQMVAQERRQHGRHVLDSSDEDEQLLLLPAACPLHMFTGLGSMKPLDAAADGQDCAAADCESHLAAADASGCDVSAPCGHSSSGAGSGEQKQLQNVSQLSDTATARQLTSPNELISVASQPVHGASVASQPVHGASVASQPVHGASVAFQPVHGASVASQPVHGASVASQLVEGTSVAAQPVDGTSIASQPVDGTSVAAQPVDDTSVASQPVDGASVASQPVDGTSIASQPVDGTSIASQPVDGTSIASASSERQLRRRRRQRGKRDADGQLSGESGADRLPRAPNDSAVTAPVSARAPVAGRRRSRATLLEKLLAKDIRREHSVLVQCIRHIVEHNFFDTQNDADKQDGGRSDDAMEQNCEAPVVATQPNDDQVDMNQTGVDTQSTCQPNDGSALCLLTAMYNSDSSTD